MLGLGLGCLTPLSTIFQLYCRSIFVFYLCHGKVDMVIGFKTTIMSPPTLVLLPTKFHEILFSSFRRVALTSCFSSKFREISKFKGA
jgi:hypothetical protein